MNVMLFFFGFLLCAPLGAAIHHINQMPETDYLTGFRLTYYESVVRAGNLRDATSESLNYGQGIQVGLAKQIWHQTFFAIRFDYGMDFESASRYGINTQERYRSQSFKEPSFYFVKRLREQSEDHGLWDLQVYLVKYWGAREVGKDNTNRYYGRNIVETKLSHGWLEDKWEFKTEFFFNYYDSGQERNLLSQTNYSLDPYADIGLHFYAQYEIHPRWFIAPGVGLIYRGTQQIRSGDSTRSIQAGTGSRLNLKGLWLYQKNLILSLILENSRADYFVSGTLENFDGKLNTYSSTFSLEYGF
jgi:hypothetical protein